MRLGIELFPGPYGTQCHALSSAQAQQRPRAVSSGPGGFALQLLRGIHGL